MSQTRLILYSAPKEFWEPRKEAMVDISPFVDDGLGIERRLVKGVNLVNERVRYQLCCKRIQEAVLRMEPQPGRVILGEGYYDILNLLYTKMAAEVVRCRIAACFFPPDMIAEQKSDFQRLTERAGISGHGDVKKRIEFYENAGNKGAGVIEISDFIARDKTEKSGYEVAMSAAGPPGEIFPGYEGEDELSEEKRQSLLEVLRTKILSALDIGGEVNFSNQPHAVIADALNKFVYKENEGEPEKSIRVIYMDGSEAEPFPLRCLDRPQDPGSGEQIRPLKASLISMRHLEMDEKVDFAWFRNRKVSVSRPYAETDAYCTNRTIELLKEIEDNEFHLHLYQTGLETAVIGFYRGFIQVLKDRRKKGNMSPLRVVPYYFDGVENGYRPGNPWV